MSILAPEASIVPLHRTGFTNDVLDAVRERILSGQSRWVVLSGKMCSGKDTLAAALPFPYRRASIGDLVRADYDRGVHIAAAYLDGVDETVATSVLSHVMGLPWERASEYLARVSDDLRADPEHDGSSRTDNSRFLLQELGSTWRTSNDPYYWAVPSAVRSIQALLDGANVVATSARYRPDVDLPRALGATIVRLDVTPQTQYRRLMNRDGLRPDESAFAHPSETALDDYEHFDLRLDANDDSPGSVERLVASVMEHLNR